MKKIIRFISMFVLIALCTSFVSCTAEKTEPDLWKGATYTKDAEFGDGTKLLILEVKAQDKSVTFKIKTDKQTVGEALSEFAIISGEQGAYGIYIEQVNGITADYSKDKSYWSFSKNGEYMTTGVDSTKFSSGEHFELSLCQMK